MLNNEVCTPQIELNPFYSIDIKTDLSDSFCSEQPTCLYQICSLDIYFAKKIENLIFEKIAENIAENPINTDWTSEVAEIGTCTGLGSSPGSNNQLHQCAIPENSPCSELSPCQNTANCTDLSSFDYECSCPEGLTGKNCETPIPCYSSPCMNSGECLNSADFSDYSCDCTHQYTGEKNCDIPIPCEFSPCSEFAVSCENSADFSSYKNGLNWFFLE